MPLERKRVFRILYEHKGDPFLAEIDLVKELIKQTVKDSKLTATVKDAKLTPKRKSKKAANFDLLGTHWRNRHFKSYLTQTQNFFDKSPSHPLEKANARIFSKLIDQHEKHCAGLPQGFQKPAQTPTYDQSYALLKKLEKHSNEVIVEKIGEKKASSFFEELSKNSTILSDALLQYMTQNK
ncbi:MAG: hypothetical protein ACE5DI_00495 [Candidatus Micrarchaeia archaeon]